MDEYYLELSDELCTPEAEGLTTGMDLGWLNVDSTSIL